MKSGPSQATPTPVPGTAKQVGEIRTRWAWVEATVWTEPMLTALENGVKGGVWFSLIDKVWRPANLRAGFARMKTNGGKAGVDHQTIAMFEEHLDQNLESLANQLQQGRYRPQAIRRAYIPKPGSCEKRPLGIPTVRDRVVQAALRQAIEPIFERDFAEHSYGFRPGRGCKDALRRVDDLLKNGHRYVVDVDLRSYFDTIPHDKLMTRIREKIADGRVLQLIESFLTQGVLEEMREWTPIVGSPQGAVISPLLSNVYLDPLDHHLAGQKFEMIRYADDFIVLCRDASEALAALEQIRNWVAAAGLTLHQTKTRIVDMDEPGGFEFLGYHFERSRRDPKRIHRWPRRSSIQKLRERMRAKTPRDNGRSLEDTIADVNRTLRGWFEYFKHTTVRSVFSRLDGWLRRRLRRILLQQQHRRGQGQGLGPAHQRWPNAFFAEHGLYSLDTAHALARQSVRR